MRADADAGEPPAIPSTTINQNVPTIRFYRTRSELEEVRGFWESAQVHPNSDYEHFLLVCAIRRQSVEPFVIGIWDKGRCEALLVGRRESHRLRPVIGYLRLPGIEVTAVTVVYAGVLGDLSRGLAHAVISELQKNLQTGVADMVMFSRLPETSELWNSFPRRWLLGAQPSEWATHRQLSLGQSPGFLLRGMRSKHRSWVKRKERELAAAHPKGVSWSWCQWPLDVPTICAKLESVAVQTYQRGLGAGFLNDIETRARLQLLADRRQLRVCLLEIEGNPKAFWLGEIYRGVFHSSATGYAPDVATFEVGTLMFLRVTDELIKEGIMTVDFGLGDAHYKERFGDHAWREAPAYVYGRGVRARVLGVYLDIAEALDRSLRAAVRRAGLVNKVKRLWRRRVRATAVAARSDDD